MSDTSNTGGSPANELQFDHAETTSPGGGAGCSGCNQPIQEVYYEVNGAPFCESCHQKLEDMLNSGSAPGRFACATLYGSLAGLLGAGIFYGVREATNMEFGLISILVGLMIGKAVQKGCDARGGWFYQGLAVFLTYTAIMLTYIPLVIKAVTEEVSEKAAAKPHQLAKPDGAVNAPDGAQTPAAVQDVLLALVTLVCLAYSIPVLIGIQSPMVFIIVLIGLYEAWVINRNGMPTINGPFQIGQAQAGSAAHVEPTG